MSREFLLEEKIIAVKKSHFEGVGVVGGLDRGCTLTKVLFSTVKDDEHYNLHFALFKNSHFEAGLDYLKEKGMVVQVPGAKLHVTGAGCDMHRELIKQKLGLEIQFINEFLTQGRGTHWLIGCADDSEICYPEPELDMSEFEGLQANNFLQKLIEKAKKDLGEPIEGQKFPCMMLFMGSGGGIMKIEENGMSDMVGGLWFAGRSFLGLSKLLLGTDDYDEILELASKGRRNNVDTEVKDVLANDPNSPYGQLPPNLPVFPFGKAVDTDKTLADLSREDLANSIVFSFAYNAFTNLALAAQTSKIPKLYMGGNFFRHELIRAEILKIVRLFTGESIALKFLITGHTGAIGAMISKPEDEFKYLAFMQQQAQQAPDGANSPA
ncbi:hypothetical protein BOX15_Mlig034563g2 [Macrostomum lignano]|uniref:Uncharacterized protein n=2 Tax=Macrostomum lignano TaxID=282301 RepID=A0A267EDG3_9PLAT|nr:hypothetical protein BOX15_Mlig034563g2 [Macrostomum lignano]